MIFLLKWLLLIGTGDAIFGPRRPKSEAERLLDKTFRDLLKMAGLLFAFLGACIAGPVGVTLFVVVGAWIWWANRPTKAERDADLQRRVQRILDNN